MPWLDSSSLNWNSKIEKRPRRLKWVGLSTIAFVLVVTGEVVQAQQLVAGGLAAKFLEPVGLKAWYHPTS
jgi:hypothetical protein